MLSQYRPLQEYYGILTICIVFSTVYLSSIQILYYDHLNYQYGAFIISLIIGCYSPLVGTQTMLITFLTLKCCIQLSSGFLPPTLLGDIITNNLNLISQHTIVTNLLIIVLRNWTVLKTFRRQEIDFTKIISCILFYAMELAILKNNVFVKNNVFNAILTTLTVLSIGLVWTVLPGASQTQDIQKHYTKRILQGISNRQIPLLTATLFVNILIYYICTAQMKLSVQIYCPLIGYNTYMPYQMVFCLIVVLVSSVLCFARLHANFILFLAMIVNLIGGILVATESKIPSYVGMYMNFIATIVLALYLIPVYSYFIDKKYQQISNGLIASSHTLFWFCGIISRQYFRLNRISDNSYVITVIIILLSIDILMIILYYIHCYPTRIIRLFYIEQQHEMKCIQLQTNDYGI